LKKLFIPLLNLLICLSCKQQSKYVNPSLKIINDTWESFTKQKISKDSLIIIFLLLIASPHSQVFQKLPEFQRLYIDAEKLYHSDKSTDASDRIAIATYQELIGNLNK